MGRLRAILRRSTTSREMPVLAPTSAVLLAIAVMVFVVSCDRSGHPDGVTTLPSDFPDIEVDSLEHTSGELGDLLEDSLTLLMFGFTHCADACPSTLARIGAAIADLSPGSRDQVNVLFVSVDPNRDDVDALQRYVSPFGESFLGATAPRVKLENMTRRHGLSFSYGDGYPDGSYRVDHPLSVLVFDADGTASMLLQPSVLEPAAITGAVEHLIAEGR